MGLATTNSWVGDPTEAVHRPSLPPRQPLHHPPPAGRRGPGPRDAAAAGAPRQPAGWHTGGWTRLAAAWLLLLSSGLGLVGQTVPPAPATNPPAGGVAYAQANFQSAHARHQAEPGNLEAACQFGRACFELAEFATNKTQRAELADLGIAACKQAVAQASNSAPAHYYLGLNYGQLARTRGLSALKLVSRMRDEWELARQLDERYDAAGADRHLGLLYRDAPSLGSIGDRKAARRHLLRAVELAPAFPENRLMLIESYLKWGEKPAARRELKALEASWTGARTTWTGPAWAAQWQDWEAELKRFQAALAEPRSWPGAGRE